MQSSDPPIHPGLELRAGPAAGYEVTNLAKEIGVDRVTMSRLLNGQQAVSPRMAIRLERWLGGGIPAEEWLSKQMAYDLWHARQALAGEEAEPKKRRR